MTINERIKNFRNQFHLSQEYVARYLGVNRATYTQMENAKRKITAEDISKLSELFGVTADALLNENIDAMIVKSIDLETFDDIEPLVIERDFQGLAINTIEIDQAEILNLIKFKEQLKRQRD